MTKAEMTGMSFQNWKIQRNFLNYCQDCGEETSDLYCPGCGEYVTLGCNRQPTNNKEHDMYDKVTATASYAFATAAPTQSLEEKQREQLMHTANITWHQHREELSEHFGISDQKSPKNAKELVARIKSGEFTFSSEYESKTEAELGEWGYSMTWGLKWRKPETKYDRDGFDAAEKVLDKAYDHVKQDVWVLPLADALTS